MRAEQVAEVNAVLEEIGAAAVPQIMVWNKIDLSGLEPGVERDEYGNISRVRLSARTGAGVDRLRQALAEAANASSCMPDAENPDDYPALMADR